MKRWAMSFSVLFFAAVIFCHRADAVQIITESYETDPVDVPAKGMKHPQSKIFMFKHDGWLIEAIPEIVNGPWRLLHHGWAFNTDRKDTLCPALPQALYATGREHIHVRFPEGYGLPVKKGEHWLMGPNGTVMLHNDDSLAYKDVRFRLTLKFYVPESGDKPLVSVKPMFLNLGEEPHLFTCTTGATYWIQPGEQIDKWSREIVVKVPFKIVVLGGHLHDYSDYIRLTVSGKELWKTSPILDSKKRILNIPTYLDADGIPVKAGDKLMLETKHTNPLNKPVDAMGIVGMGIVMEGSGIPLDMPSPNELPKKEKKPEEEHHHHEH